MRYRVEIRRQEEEPVAKVAMPQKKKQWKELVHSIWRNAQEREMKCFECEGEEHQCRNCCNRRKEKKVTYVAKLQKVQQEE